MDISGPSLSYHGGGKWPPRKKREAGTRGRHKRVLLDELKICTSSRNLKRGKEIHIEAMETGNCSCIYFATALVNMYTKCRSMEDARRVFDSMKHPDVVSWTALILGYADNGEGLTALHLFARMRLLGCTPNSLTFSAALKACTSLALGQNGSTRAECLERGKDIHSKIGCHLDMKLQNTLIDMYAKCGSMTKAREVFDAMKQPDVVSWSCLMLGYAENGEGIVALNLFQEMTFQGCVADSFTFVAALKACISLAMDPDRKAECLKWGKFLQSYIGELSDIYVRNTLIKLYSMCGSMSDARQVFEDMSHPHIVSWNALILGYVENGEGVTALELFARMMSEACSPDSFTIVAALKACSSLALDQNEFRRGECLERGREIHLQNTCHLNLYVQNTLIDMYAKCGSMIEALQVFENIKHPDVVSWNALVLGYAENGEGVTALLMFARMRFQGCNPTSLTFVAALKACGLLGALECGRKIHVEIDTTKTEWDAMLVTSLVDFYAKCGELVGAQKVFDSSFSTRNLATWNALLGGYSGLGDIEIVYKLLEGLQDASLRPNGVTFLCVLMCCNHAGCVDKGKECLEAMSLKYGIIPAVEHYTCLIDILGTSNMLDDAIALLQKMPCRPNGVTWMSVLSSCCKWKNIHIGRLAFKSLLSFDGTNASSYVLMAQIYECHGMWREQEMMLTMGKGLKVWRQPGETCWTDGEGEVHTFLT